MSHLSRKYDSRTLSGWFDFRGLHTSPILAFPRQVSKLRSHRKIEDKSGDSDKSAQTEKSTKQDQNHEEKVTGHTSTTAKRGRNIISWSAAVQTDQRLAYQTDQRLA